MLIVQPDILYVFYIVINGRLEASGMKSVYCVLSQSSHHICTIIISVILTDLTDSAALIRVSFYLNTEVQWSYLFARHNDSKAHHIVASR